MKPVIIIAAISSRAHVQAALEAGFEVIAIDAFCDVDTQNLAQKIFQVDAANGKFNAQQLLNAVDQINVAKCMGFCYGAGFEAQPDLLVIIAQRLPLIGNSAVIINSIKMPHIFFSLCDSLKMAYPATQFERPINCLGWLQKQIGGSGGAHIKQVLPLDIASDKLHYYQKNQAGTPYSCLFLADGSNSQVMGFNQQWCEPSTLLPYRFGGVVSHANLSNAIKSQLEQFVQAATQYFGLRGINSCDFLVHDDSIFMLEINPRLSASLQLYRAQKGNLFAAHVQACLGQLIDWPIVDKKSRAMQIIYANKTAQVPPNMDWPDWVCDIPQPNTEIAAGQPICTVLAQARTAKSAKKKLLQRTTEL